MANPILIKRSAVASKVPTTSDIALGELAINTFDGKLFLKKNNGTDAVVEVGGNANNPSFTGNLKRSVATISAVGTTQATAGTIPADINVINISVLNAGVILPANITGANIILVNITTNAIMVYPPSGGAVDTLGANVGFSLPGGAKIMFIATSTNQYYTLNATYA